jgi:phosphonate transport system substrate-binding protein
MKKYLVVFWVSFWVLACLPAPQTAWAHESANVIKFGVFPYKSPRTIVKLFAPIAKRLEQALGLKVQLVTAPDFQTYVARGKLGDYDLAFPCVTCFFQIQASGYTVIARGEPSFYGGTLVRKDSGIESPEQLKGKKIASIGRHSYAGYLFLVEELHEQGIDPKGEAEFHFLGKLDTIIYGVFNRKYDAGTVRRDALESPVFKDLKEDLKFISTSAAIPQFPFVVKTDMAPDRVATIRQVLTAFSMDNEDDKKVLQSLRLRQISPAVDGDYDAFRITLRQVQELAQ